MQSRVLNLPMSSILGYKTDDGRASDLRHEIACILARCGSYSDQHSIVGVSEAVAGLEAGMRDLSFVLTSLISAFAERLAEETLQNAQQELPL